MTADVRKLQSGTVVKHGCFSSLHQYVNLTGRCCAWTPRHFRVEFGIQNREVEAPIGEMDTGLAVGAEDVLFRLLKFVSV